MLKTNMDPKLSAEALAQSQALISPLLHRTPVLKSHKLNELLGAELFFKCENFQKTGSFKARGALNALAQLAPQKGQQGVATHSSGNHGQALAWAAAQKGWPCYVVMPENAPQVKMAAVRGYGAEVVLCAPTLAAREESLQRLVKEKNLQFIPPYDHLDIIAGQSSCAAEFLAQSPGLDSLIAPVGGGGLLAGSALSAHYWPSEIAVFGAEPAGADDAYRSFHSGQRVEQHQPETIADGLRTTLGRLNFPIIQERVNDILLAEEEGIVAALRLIYERLKIVVEPSCAVPLAALMAQKKRFAGQKVGLILSGGNVDLSQLTPLFATSEQPEML